MKAIIVYCKDKRRLQLYTDGCIIIIIFIFFAKCLELQELLYIYKSAKEIITWSLQKRSQGRWIHQ